VPLLVLVMGLLFGSSQAMATPGGTANSGSPEPDSDEAVPEYRIKAAFIYNFVRYTTWPEEALGTEDDPIEMVVIGKSPFRSSLDKTFARKLLHGRPVRIRYLASIPEELKAHLVFTVGLSPEDTNALAGRLRSKNVLVIGDQRGFAERGSCANFYLEDSKIRFEVNTDEVKASGLKISSQLLKLASIVKTKERKR
jgi:hypothetical protein